jgi:segregation and condensation protein A
VAKDLSETKNNTVEDELVLEQDTEHKQSPKLTPMAADDSVVEPAVESVADGESPEQPPAGSEHKPRLDELRNVGSQQGEMPFAIVQGQALTEIPQDLYIPPDALEVFLEAFEGPLDLLLYLIKRQNIDILEINVARITAQYMQYVNMMSAVQFELAAEYLLMAAMLAEIKSRMLLPRSSEVEDDEEDPRAQLIRRLQEYERFKQAAEDMDELPRLGRDLQLVSVDPPDIKRDRPEPEVEMKELLLALGEVLRRADMFESHHISREKLSTRERMSQVLSTLTTDQFTPFVSLFTVDEGRLGVIVTFLAIMELIKESLIEIVQTEAFGPIHVKARAS